MNPIIATLLIPFLLAGQLIAAAPHWHGEVRGSMDPPHDEQAHFHLHALSGHSVAGHHSHEHEAVTPNAPAEEPVSGEHDGDAVYIADVDVLNEGGSVKVPDLATSLLLFEHVLPSYGQLVHNLCPWSSPGVDRLLRPKCARYQQLLSIRC